MSDKLTADPSKRRGEPKTLAARTRSAAVCLRLRDCEARAAWFASHDDDDARRKPEARGRAHRHFALHSLSHEP